MSGLRHGRHAHAKRERCPVELRHHEPRRRDSRPRRPNPDEENVAARCGESRVCRRAVNKEEDEDEDEEGGEAETRTEPAKVMAPNSKRAREGTESEDGPDTPKVAEAKRVGGEALPANASLPSSPQPMPTNVTTAFDSPQIPAASPSCRSSPPRRRAYPLRRRRRRRRRRFASPRLPSTNPPSRAATPPRLFGFLESPPSSPTSRGLTSNQPSAPSNADAAAFLFVVKRSSSVRAAPG